jgi:DNA-binding response OmpR family regulator
MHRILVVEDDPAARALFVAALTRSGLTCDVAHDGSEAIAKLRRETYCSVLLDLLLPTVNGFEVLQFIRAERAAILPRVIVTTGADAATLRHFDSSGLWKVLHKPVEVDVLYDLVLACAQQADHDH